ncbi:BREX system P-loop protein BrxC [Peptostreptococcus sp.]|uniref:BREX system P-loop protein BrxC n=1 Tax=Peptostreptococcus sp. TaxID=1262 RepID=UPI001CB01A97|nr:BREX system P-loop protein BrxC [Peptostreptococcus sp.]MBF1049794.1 BREX system P-loop protein BrxC [Peptostreptococcus sp.]
MDIKNIFSKPIDRDIKGVIKVGQDDSVNIQQELEEYVVTRELQKHFSDFFASYKMGINGNTDKMGVWISGFFGSGKSHFLKILSYLLANKKVNGKTAFQYFEEDNKLSDPMVLADIKLASSVPTDVVLFNIDSKSEVNGKQSKVAIVSVLQNVFNEMQGFSGYNPFLADLERKLFYEGKFDLFKEKFEENFGDSWIEARNDFDFIQDDVVEVLADIDFMSEDAGRNWCEKAIGEYPYKVEAFSNLVKEYLYRKGNNHHIAFLIDEIGQYIGDDSKLMLNLQTVTEDLGTACQGKAWIIVTSQQDIDSITKTKGNDFSKIQGRFDTRLSLSSANVDEVIKKRILKKNEIGKQTLELLHDDKATVIKNLILFNDGVEKKLYSSRSNFSDVYPFIPYQFNLLASVLTSIRTHGASGKHLAEGERSMLALFKESAVKVMNTEVGTIVPFNMFYDALEQFLDHSHKGVISRAWDNEYLNPNHEKECFDVNVLKTLFMIKYVKEIKANVGNITSLMVSNIDEDRIDLSSKVEDSLKRLIRQTLVQKNGDIYVFLTDEEQEINRAIESQSVDSSEVINKVSELIFDGLYDEKKYRHTAFKGRYAFGFNQFVDDKPYRSNQSNDITLKILTPNSDEPVDETSLKLISGREGHVLVVLPDDRSFLDEIHSALQIEKFIRYDSTSTIMKFETIKESKKVEMRERNALAKLFLSESLKEATIYVSGDKLQTNTKDITSRINEAIGKSVSIVYHKLYYIDAPMGENDIRELFRSKIKELSFAGEGQTKNKLALNEVKEYITMNTQRHTKTSIKTLLDRYLKAPYGFVEADVWWLVAKLFKDGDLALFVNNEAVTLLSKSEEEIIRYITRKEFNEKLMTEIKVRANEKQKKSVKEVMKELFGITPSCEEDDAVMKSFLGQAEKLKVELEKLKIYYSNQHKYPGKLVVDKGKKLMNDVLQIKYSKEFFFDIDNKKDDYLDFAEDYEPVERFFSGEQKGIFDKAIKLMDIYEDSKTFIVNSEIEKVVSDINDIIKSSNPYRKIFELPELSNKFTSIYTDLLQEMQEPVDQAIQDARKRVFDELEGKHCYDVLVNKFISLFQEISDKTETCNNVATLQNIKVEVDALKIRCLNNIHSEEVKMIALQQPLKSNLVSGRSGEKSIDSSPIPVKKSKTISIKSVNNVSSWQIETEEDVKKYIEKLENKLINLLEDNTIINIEF